MTRVDDRSHQTLPNKRPRSHSVIIPDEEEGELSLLRRAIDLSSLLTAKIRAKRKYVFQNYWVFNRTDRISDCCSSWGCYSMESIGFPTREPWIFPWSAARSFSKHCSIGWQTIGGELFRSTDTVF